MCNFLRFSTLLALVLVAPSVFGFTVVPEGSVSGIWSAAGSPYLIQGDIGIPDGTQLSITPGVEVVFEGLYQLDVWGSLLAIGAAQDSVVFTAIDQEVGWKGVYIQPGADLSVLDHCIIEYGRASERPTGGGIYCLTANMTLTNSRISNNRARYGGGVYIIVSEGTPTVSNCIFSHNFATKQGGGIYVCGPQIVLTDCLVEDNSIDGEYGQYLGGAGIMCAGWLSGSAEISGCTVRSNRIQGFGRGAGIAVDGALILGLTIADCDIVNNFNDFYGGGGIFVSGAQECDISNCRFSDNYAPFSAGAGYSESGSALAIAGGNSTISHCTFDHNFCAVSGTLFCRISAVITVESCTFSHNMDNCVAGGGALRLEGDATITNTIVSNQQSNFGGNPSAGINFISGTHTVQHCDLFGNFGGIDFTGPAMPEGLGTITGVNVNGDPCDDCANIFLNSLFCDAPEGNLQVAENSPCLGAGQDGVTIGALEIGCQAIGVPGSFVPLAPRLMQNYPNPFNPATTIEFILPRAGRARLAVLDARGRLVATLVDGPCAAGRNAVLWDGTDDRGGKAASGVYRYQITVRDHVESRAMVLIR